MENNFDVIIIGGGPGGYVCAIRAAQLGFKVIEVPVTRSYPKHGKVPTKISPIKGNLTVIKKLLEVVTGKYNL